MCVCVWDTHDNQGDGGMGRPPHEAHAMNKEEFQPSLLIVGMYIVYYNCNADKK